jgi:hypothetical protein
MKRNVKLFLLSAVCMLTAGNVWAEDHYLVGGCTASGWNSGEWQRTPVAMVNVAENVWVWSGTLSVADGDNGRFKIPNQAEGWDGYWAPNQGTVLTSEWSDLSTNGNGDYKYCVSEAGVYRVTINTSELKIKAEKVAEPSKDGDYYLIGSVDDYYWYAGQVTSTGNALKARLTADLDFATVGFFPLACDRFKFKGEFDGAGHAMSNMVIMGSNNNLGLIRYAAGGANIHDVVIGDGTSSFTGSAKIGGVIGFVRDGGTVTLTNVINKANVRATGNSDANAAGLFGCAVDNTIVTATNCANMGEVRGQDGNCAAFAGWTQNGTSFTNCWNSGAIYNMESNCNLYRNTGAVTATNCFDATGNNAYTQGTKEDASTIATGELCYHLNGDQSSIHWYQNLSGTLDAYPVPFSSHAQVYANGRLYCDGTAYTDGTTFENEDKGIIRDEHHYNEWGFCDNLNGSSVKCDDLQMDFMTPVDGYYEIGNNKQLNWFAVYVNTKDNTVNAKLTADIDFSEQDVMIGNADNIDVAYKGTFDGQGHKVTLGYTRSEKHGALFMYLYSGSVVRNLVTDGSITMTGAQHGSGIFGGSRGNALVENCVSYVTINSNINGDATIGGIGAYMFDTGTIRNCAFLGTINAENANGNGGILGYANGGASVNIQNCYVNANINVKYVANSSKIITRNTATLTNCYYGGSMGNMENYITGSSTPQATEASVEVIGSGELAYLLNGGVSGGTSWYQVIGTDPQPLPIAKDGAIVYANGQLYCDGLPKPGSSFENEEKETVRDAHTFGEWGFCTAEHDAITCNQIQPEFATLTDGYYQIGNAKELNWFAVWTDRESASVNAKLTADIDMTEVANFPGIGSGDKNFTGIFDGQRHIISNMTMDWEREGVGLVNRAASGAQVKNVTIASNCSFRGSKAVAGLIGGLYGGGDVYIENSGNEGSVESTGQNAGGVCGVCFNGTILHLTNVYNVGEIRGATANESGSLSGWMSDAVLVNCYSIAGYPTSEDTHGFQQGNQFARGNGINLTNCYDYGTGDWGQNNGSWGVAFADDRKIAEVNEWNMAKVFAGLFNGEGGTVWRMEYEGWEHPVLYGDNNIAILHEEATNRIIGGTYDVNFYRTLKTDVWNTFCVPFDITNAELKAAFGDGVKVAKYAETADGENSTVSFTTMANDQDAITANEPVLLKPSKDASAPIAFTSRTVKVGETIVVGEGNYDFVGSYDKQTEIAEDDYYLSANKLYKSKGIGSYIMATRAYIKAKDGGQEAHVASFFIDGEGETTGIKPMHNAEFIMHNNEVYNLNGQRVNSSLRKGLYIRDGKKVIVK